MRIAGLRSQCCFHQRSAFILQPAALVFLALGTACALYARPLPVVISEIHYHPVKDPAAQSFGVNEPGEFVELYNPSDESLDLSGWYFDKGISFVFPAGTVLMPYSYLVVAHNQEYFRRLYPNVGAVVGDFNGNLSNGRDIVALRAPDGTLVDQVAYDDDDPWPENPDGLGPSLERTDYLADGTQQWVWRSSIPLGGTPGAPNSTYQARITRTIIAPGDTWRYFKGIREPASPIGAWTRPDFNDSSWPEGPSGFGYGDNDDATVLSDMRDNYTTVYVRKSFTLVDPAAFVSLTLTVSYDDAFVAYLNGTEIWRSQSAGGTPGVPLGHSATAADTHEVTDGAAVIDLTGSPLLRAGRNVLAIQVLNESRGSSDLSLIPSLVAAQLPEGAMIEPPHDFEIDEVYRGARPEESFIEIYYEGKEPADLSGFRLVADPTGKVGYTFPPGTIMNPGAFLVVTGDLLPFPVEDVAQWFGLVTEDGRFVDGVETWSRPTGRAWGRWPDGNGRFYVLDSPTPGGPNAYTPNRDVVINEVRYHPPIGAGTEEYVELYNRTDHLVDLGGWSLRTAVSYTFAEGQVLQPHGFLVVARDPEAVQARYGISGVLGPWTGGLANSEEKIELYDALGNRVDVVHYADDGTWPNSTLTEGPDGFGPSIELVNPGMENNHGSAWRTSAGFGTPGARNSTFDPDPAPVIRSVSHFPPVPLPGGQVTIRARVSDESSVASVNLYWRNDGASTFSSAPMSDPDGDTYWEAVIPGRSAGTIVQFYIRARDTSGNSRAYPPDAPRRTCLFQVDDNSYPNGVPVYRLIMRQADFEELTTRDVESDVLLDGTFIRGKDIYYNVGVRYRGENSRHYWRKAFRVQFSHDRRFEDIKRLNLNAQDTYRAHLATDFFRRADVPTFQSRIVAFTLNLNFGNAYGGIYERVEAVDRDFLRRTFPGDDEGNLYRGRDFGGSREANLSYRGNDPSEYEGIYEKKTNQLENDYSDIIALTDAFENTPDDEFLSVISSLIDVDEWLRFFAAQNVVSNQDGNIATSSGEDFFLYRRPSDGRFIIIPWDLNETFFDPGDGLFRSDSRAVQRLLHHRQLVRKYFMYVKRFVEGPLSEEAMLPRIERLRPYYAPEDLDAVAAFVPTQREAIESAFPDRLTVGLTAQYLVRSGDTWRFFRGTREPSGGTSAWTRLDFDDSSWEEGPSGFGYGDGDDRTLLTDMRGNYTTVYIRRVFQVPDPAALAGLTFAINYDDGFVAYLNGTEIARRNVSGRVRFDERATADHEAGRPLIIDLTDSIGLLRSGANILAVVGVNASSDSSDFSLDPELYADGRGGGCGARLYATGPLTLGGTAPVPETAFVNVNGQPAQFDILTGKWYFETSHQDGERQFIVEALNESGLTVAQVTAFVVDKRPANIIGAGSVSGSWSRAEGPYLVTGSVRVPAGETLTLGPGTHVLFETSAALRVEGTLRISGTESQPVILEISVCNGSWGGIVVEGNGTGRLASCEIIGAATESAGETRNAAVLVRQSGRITISDSAIKDCPAPGIVVVGPDAFLRITNTQIAACEGAVISEQAPVDVDGLTVHNSLGRSAVITLSGSTTPQSVLRRVVIESGPADGIKLLGSNALIRESTVANVTDSGIACEEGGSPQFLRVLIYGCEDAFRLYGPVNAFIDRCTISSNLEGLDCRTGATATVESSIIWGNAISVLRDDTVSLTINYSDIQGGFPGTANGDFDPLFVDPERRDFHLKPGSPAIGAGRDGVDMGTFPSGLQPTERFVRGDVNADGTSDISDAVSLLLFLFGSGHIPCEDAADSNDDGALNVADAVAVLSYLFAGSGPLPAPSDSCGPDPTSDQLGCRSFAPCNWGG